MNMHTNLIGERILISANYKDERLNRQSATIRAAWIDADDHVSVVAETFDGRFVTEKLGACVMIGSAWFQNSLDAKP